MEEKSLATELLRELKKESHRRFVLLIICIILLFASNMAWLVAWNLPVKETVEESYDLEGKDDANVILNGEGEVHINEPYSGNENKDNSKARQTPQKKMNIKDFTKPELDFFREQCNFVGIENDLFELRSQGVPLEQIAEMLDVSIDGAKKVSRRVNKKIIRVL